MTEEQTTLPEPLTPPDCDLRSMDWFPFFHKRLKRSAFWLAANDSVRVISLDLWCESYEQVPAGSLPDCDIALAEAAGFGRRNVHEWRQVRDDVMSAWTMCSDGRFYHATLCEVANDTYRRKLIERARKKGTAAADRARARLEELYGVVFTEPSNNTNQQKTGDTTPSNNTSQQINLDATPSNNTKLRTSPGAAERNKGETPREQGVKSAESPNPSAEGARNTHGDLGHKTRQDKGTLNTHRSSLTTTMSPSVESDDGGGGALISKGQTEQPPGSATKAAAAQLTAEPVPKFEAFWEAMPRRITPGGKLTRGRKSPAKRLWAGLSLASKHAAMAFLPRYASAYPDGTTGPCHAERYISQRRWLDELDDAPTAVGGSTPAPGGQIASVLPKDFSVPREWREYAEAVGCAACWIDSTALLFVQHYREAAEPKNASADWRGVWVAWCQSAKRAGKQNEDQKSRLKPEARTKLSNVRNMLRGATRPKDGELPTETVPMGKPLAAMAA